MPARSTMLRVVVTYAIVATLWILFSDTLIGNLSDQPATLVMLGTLKGLAFVGLTSMLLYALLRRRPGAETATTGGGRWLLVSVAVLSLLIVVAGAAAMRQAAERHQAQTSEQLRAMARLKAGQIESWLGERRKDVELMRSAPALNWALRRWQRDGDTVGAEIVRERLASVQRIGGYRTVAVIDAAGQALFAAGERCQRPGEALGAAIARALSSGESQSTDVYRDGEELHLDFVAPLTTVIGAPDLLLLLRLHQDDFLLPFLQVLPVPSASAETLLVRRDGDAVLFLNELRHRADSALKLRLPISDSELLAVQVVSGRASPGQPLAALDYRGVPVLGVAVPVAGTAWWLIAKIDRQELEHALQTDLLWIALSITTALFSVVFFGIMLRQQQHLRSAEAARQAQAEALHVQRLVDRQREERSALVSHYQTMVGKARDIILLLDDGGHIVDANQAAVAAYGWSADELRARHVRDLRGEENLAVFERQWQASADPNGALFEALHRRRDGSCFPVEISARAVEIEGKPYRQSFVRDISERKKADAALRRSNRALRTLGECNQALVRASDEADLLADICRLLVDFGGYRLAWVGYADGGDDPGSVHPVAQAGGEDGYPAALGVSSADVEHERDPTGTAIRERRAVVAQNLLTDPRFGPWRDAALRRGYAASIALPLVTGDDTCLGALSLYAGAADAFDADETQLLVDLAGDLAYGIRALRDRGARDRAEATLRATAQQLEHLLEASPTVLYALHFIDGVSRPVQVSANVERVIGYTIAEILQGGWWEACLHPDDRGAAMTAASAGAESVHEYRFAHKDGHYLWIRDERRRIGETAGQPAEIVGAWTDITAARQATLALQESERRYREMFSANPQPMWVCDRDTLAFLDVNEAAIHRYGYRHEEFLGMTIKDIRPPEEIPRLLRHLAQVGGNVDQAEVWRHRRRDGSEMLVEITSHALDFGGRRAAVVLAHEVTERERNKARLLAQLAELRRWHAVTQHREGRVLELKREVNALLAEAGRPLRYGVGKMDSQ